MGCGSLIGMSKVQWQAAFPRAGSIDASHPKAKANPQTKLNRPRRPERKHSSPKPHTIGNPIRMRCPIHRPWRTRQQPLITFGERSKFAKLNGLKKPKLGSIT
jgi:hypothetical protein